MIFLLKSQEIKGSETSHPVDLEVTIIFIADLHLLRSP